MSFYRPDRFLPRRFGLIQSSFLQSEGLPFADVLSEIEIQRAFADAGVDFAQEENEICTPPLTLWAFLSQVLHKGEQRSCMAAVSRQDSSQCIGGPSREGLMQLCASL